MKVKILSIIILLTVIAVACKKNKGSETAADPYAAIKLQFGTRIDPTNLLNYAAQAIPNYIVKNNSVANPINNAKATLGRVLFYDKALSINNTVSCGSCHRQEYGFSDTALVSNGVEGGTTGRHSMRLINAMYAVEQRFFWDERAPTLEAQTTAPIKDHAEMGFSGTSGRPEFNAVISKLQNIGYYKELFKFVFGDETVTEVRMQDALANFIRSINSFDSKFDQGRTVAPNGNVPFNNFTASENAGKQLFLAAPQFDANGLRIGGGVGCNGCHNAPEFDIAPNSNNNGVVGKIGGGVELNITRSPSLRDVVRANGATNGQFMHNGNLKTLLDVVNHYNAITLNPNLDNRLRPGGNPQQLQMAAVEKTQLIDFLKTLSGTNVYSDIKWSSPF